MIAKICKKLIYHYDFLSYICTCKIGQPIQPIWQHFVAVSWSAHKKPSKELNFFHTSAILSSSRHEKCCQASERLLDAFLQYGNIPCERQKMHILWDFSWVCVPLCRHCACFALLHQCLQARKHHNNRWLVGLWLANVKGIMLPILKNVSFFFRDSHFVSYYI